MRIDRILATAVVLCATIAVAQTPERKVQTVTGQDAQLVILVQVKPDCSPGPIPEFRIDLAPANGWLVVRNGKVRLPDNAPQCKGAEVPVNALFYRPKPGFSGEDRASIEVAMGGTLRMESYTISVNAKP
jgi:hypothetical protein